MKIRAYADLHLFFDNNDMERYINNELHDLIHNIMDNKVDMIVFCGDLAHTTYQSSDKRFINILNFVKNVINVATKTKTQVRIIQGTTSHDGRIVEILNLMFSDSPVLKCITSVTYEHIDGLILRYLPESYFASYTEFKSYAFSKPADITFFHGMVEGTMPMIQQKDSVTNLPKSVVISQSDLIQNTTHFSAGGHIHKHINFNNKIFYINALTTHNFSDLNDIKGYMEFEIKDGDYTYTYIENKKAPKYIEVPIKSLHKLNRDEIKSIVGNVMITYKSTDFIRFLLTGDRNIQAMTNIAFIKTITKNYNIKIKDKLDEIEHKEDLSEDSDFFSDHSVSIADKINKIALDKYNITLSIEDIEKYIQK